MFRIYDGREHFYQWDLNRKLIVEDAGVKEVHFCNRTDNCSLVCETYVEGDFTLVNVPNILLQTDWKIRVYAYDGAYTKHDECYEVKGRSKPADYVYTETEVLDYKDLEERIKVLEENGGGGTGAVASVNGKTGTVVLSAADVGALEEELRPRVMMSPNKNDVYTKTEIDLMYGDIEAALNEIIDIQSHFIGGETQ